LKNKILIVEDIPVVALFLKDIVENLGFEGIVNIDTIEKAIHKIEIEQPVLVLLDIKLKNNEDGIEIGKYLQQKQTIPFIYVSSFSTINSFELATATLPQGCLYKPYDLHKIKDLIIAILGLKLGLQVAGFNKNK
jgi:DNA-binding NtrC family response regulator